MVITLNIGLEVSKNYLPSSVEEMHLQPTNYLAGRLIQTASVSDFFST